MVMDEQTLAELDTAQLREVTQQLLGHFTQLRGVQFCQRLLIHHHGQ